MGESDNFVDGGALYKNPSVFAFAIIREHYQLQSLPITGVVSLGDGLMPAMELGKLVKDNYYSHFIPSTAVSWDLKLHQKIPLSEGAIVLMT